MKNIFFDKLTDCDICPRACHVNRLAGEKGFCNAATENLDVASVNLHFGEEPPISGINGSGTIFFSHCTLACVYCQNYPISQFGNGKVYSIEDLSKAMLKLQDKGAHNINFVTPTHYSLHIQKIVTLSRENGLKIPIVYNCSGYESCETLELLDGIVDVYLVDAKYSDNEIAYKYSNVKNYAEINNKAIKFMLDRVGHLKLDENGIAKRGVIVRHLVLPNHLENTIGVLNNLNKISNKLYLSFMSQYHPAYKSCEYLNLSTKVKKSEYKKGVEYLEELGFENGWVQE